jgi:RimJ/RimL family protein N-acetyltransferase
LDGRPIGEGWLQEMNYPRVLARYPGKDCRRIDLLIGERSRWGQGYGTDAIRALVRFGFEQEGADYLFACSVGDYNPRSRRAFERVGFAVDQVIIERIGPKSRREFDLMLSRCEYIAHVP